MPNFTNDPVASNIDGANSTAITATATGAGSLGISAKGDASGVRGEGTTWHGVVGVSRDGFGVYGSAQGSAVVGESQKWMGVYGKSSSMTGGAGVWGEAIGPGVVGKSQTWHGVYGETSSTTGGAGVWGEHKGNGNGVVGIGHGGVGVWATSEGFEAVHAESKSPATAAIAAYQLNPAGTGAAIYGESRGHGPAAFFRGDVVVTGDIKLINADCAEEFTIGVEAVEPGTVMVLGDEGALFPSAKSHDRRVAGVIAGAGDFKPGIILDKQALPGNRQPVALVGKTFCKVDAGYGSIQIGDLLTTSDTPGHAMRASDPAKAFGAVIGKALCPLQSGKGLIPILIALQ
ncbi:MAG: hypothetical protein C5B51_12235 [Terriglobia bacterium]|nr:MAG: hypothetical protein C5B51_12235 [Terriglobia bacterium]